MKSNRYLYFGSILFLFCSCSRYYYKPNAVNAPLFTDGGQSHISAVGSVGGVNDDYDGNTYFFDVQGSVSPVNHLGIIGNYSTYVYKPDAPDGSNGNVTGRAHLLEFGVGGYYAKGKKFKMVVDGYVGYGEGKINSDVNMKPRRFFVQPGIGVTSPWFDASFNLRISNVKYKDFDPKGRDINYLQDQDLIDSYGRRIDQKSYTFVEPAFTLRTGFKSVKAQFQMALAQEFNNVQWEYNPVRFTAGVSFAIEEMIKR